MSEISAALADHVATAGFDSLPPEAVHAAKRSLLDAIGVTLAASTLGEGCRAFVDVALADGGDRTSTIVGFAAKVPPGAAAMANGAMAHALDFEDAHDTALVHPNAQTIPAVLALAEPHGSSGREVITAVAVGCDLVCRLGLALRDDPARHGWYPPAILQAFGAAAGAARMLGLDTAATVDALSLTLAQVTGTSEMTRSPRSMVRGVRDGFGAHAGVLAARLAERGVAGFDAPFEGEAGLFALYATGRFDPDGLLDDLGRRYEGASVGFKPWPSCRGTHAAIQAILALRESGLTADDVDQIVVVGSPLNRMLCEPREQRVAPATGIDAKFSLPYTVARALVHGQVGLDAFTPEALADQQVLSMAERVRYEVEVGQGANVDPGSATRCRLGVTMTDGEQRWVTATAPGGTDAPISDTDLVAKFLANAAHAAVPLDPVDLDTMVETVMDLEHSADVGADLMSLLGPR